MHLTKHFGVTFLCLLAPAAHSQVKYHEYAVKGGCVLGAQAYFQKSYFHPGSSQYMLYSRYTVWVAKTPKDGCQWDLTTADNTEVSKSLDNPARLPYGSKRQTTVYATLHQYDTYEELVTFHNLDLAPLADDFETEHGITPRFLALKSAVTATTPSGIQVTLPAQNVQHFSEMFSDYNGPADALFIRIETTPSQKIVALPKSPLYQKHPQPVRITLDCIKPNTMVSYQADNTYKIIAVGLPDLKTVMHLDTLTLIVRQRVDLKSVPVALTVPIDRSVGR